MFFFQLVLNLHAFKTIKLLPCLWNLFYTVFSHVFILYTRKHHFFLWERGFALNNVIALPDFHLIIGMPIAWLKGFAFWLKINSSLKNSYLQHCFIEFVTCKLKRSSLECTFHAFELKTFCIFFRTTKFRAPLDCFLEGWCTIYWALWVKIP